MKTRHQRLKILSIFYIISCTQCTHGAPVEAAHGTDKIGFTGNITGEFKSRFNTFGTRITEIDFF